MKKIKALSILKLGLIKNGKRIWIANRNILKAFRIGDVINTTYDKSNMQVILERADILGSHTVSSRESGQPIIDIKNNEVANVFGSAEKVEVTFFEGKIIVKASYQDRRLAERLANTSNTVFDFFSGGGTASYFFKKEGFQSVGALDIEDKYLSVYEANHSDNTESLTICASLDEVDPSYFDFDKVNASVVVAGIPCTNYSGANVSLHKELKNKREGLSYDSKRALKQFDAETLTYYLVNAIERINPHTVVIEEVEEYAKVEGAVNMLRGVLIKNGYKITENIIESELTKRKRWVMVANMQDSISLENVAQKEGCMFSELLGDSERIWITKEESKRLSGADSKSSIGIRDVDIYTEAKINTITTHMTRHTEPVLSKVLEDGTKVYSELTNEDVKKIHGLGEDYVLSGVKTTDRQILGQGVTEIFRTIAKRIASVNLADAPTALPNILRSA